VPAIRAGAIKSHAKTQSRRSLAGFFFADSYPTPSDTAPSNPNSRAADADRSPTLPDSAPRRPDRSPRIADARPIDPQANPKSAKENPRRADVNPKVWDSVPSAGSGGDRVRTLPFIRHPVLCCQIPDTAAPRRGSRSRSSDVQSFSKAIARATSTTAEKYTPDGTRNHTDPNAENDAKKNETAVRHAATTIIDTPTPICFARAVR
jgi:hypothetical protein